MESNKKPNGHDDRVLFQSRDHFRMPESGFLNEQDSGSNELETIRKLLKCPELPKGMNSWNEFFESIVSFIISGHDKVFTKYLDEHVVTYSIAHVSVMAISELTSSKISKRYAPALTNILRSGVQYREIPDSETQKAIDLINKFSI